MLSEFGQSFSTEGIKWNNAHHLLLMLLPNIFHPNKLAANIRHPIHEFVHTGHKQYPLENNALHVVEHKLFGRLVTVDVVKEDMFPKGIIPRAKQLFSRDFYYGHREFFPLPFKLVERTYVRGEIFDFDTHIKDLLNSQ